MLRTKMRKTYKYRLYPTKRQEVALLATLDICRILYNSCLVDRKNHYQSTGKGLSRMDQQRVLVDDKKRVESLHGIHSQVLQDVLFRVERAYQGFFRRLANNEGKPGYPRLKGEGRYDSITYPQEPGFRVEDGRLRLSKIGTIKIKMHRVLVGQVKTCTIRKNGKHWYACFSVEYAPVKRPVPAKAIGIDVGIETFATLSDGREIENPKYLRKSETRLVRVQRSLSRKKKGSANRRKARVRVADVYRKTRNQRNDFHHKEARNIVNECGIIAAEDLKIKNMVRNRHLSKSISDAGWGTFLNILAYKAEEAGCRFIRVDPQYTSVICSGCGAAVPKTLAVRVHRCPACGLVIGRDHNAAINVLDKATLPQGLREVTPGESLVQSGHSLNQEAPSVREG